MLPLKWIEENLSMLRSTGLISKFLLSFYHKICISEGDWEEKGGNTNFKTKHTNLLHQKQLQPCIFPSPPPCSAFAASVRWAQRAVSRSRFGETRKSVIRSPLFCRRRRRSGRKSYVQGLISTKGRRGPDDGMGDGISPWNVCSE